MGTFIEVDYNKQIDILGSKHIPYEKLMSNFREILDKNNKYYIYCNGGVKSRKVVSILEFYGYDVTLVEK